MENKQLSYWVENQSKFYRQFLRDEHTSLTLERKSALENFDLSGWLKVVVQVNGTYARITKYQINQKVNTRLSIFHYGKWSYPGNNDYLAPIFLNISLYDIKAKNGDGYFSLCLLHKYSELLNNMAFKCRFVDLQNK